MIRRVIVVGGAGAGALVLGIAILIGVGSGSGGSGCGSAPSAVGEPQLIQYYIDAAQAYNLGGDGYAYLAAINYCAEALIALQYPASFSRI